MAAAAIYVDAASVLVKPDVARAQIAADRPAPGAADPEPGAPPGDTPGTGGSSAGGESTPPFRPRRFFGTVEIDPDRAGRDMGQLAEEVLQHLTTLPGGEVTVTVEIESRVPDGVSEDLRRAIDENCRTLGFKSHGFEES